MIGTGYVGLTTGACFAHLGHEVVCGDIDASKIDRLNHGEIPIVEHRLDELVAEGMRAGRLHFVVGGAAAVEDCEIAFLCVPTPQGEDGSADLSYVEAAAREIGPVLPYEAIVVNKSTVPVGSTKVVERVMKRPDIRVVSNPEFLREGSAVEDFLRPDRVVVGSDDRAAAIAVGALYDKVHAQVIVTDPASAETIKYAANAFLATKLSFINAIAAICEGVGADVNDVVVGMGYDKRIGTEFLRPGPGWGGSCFDGGETCLVRDDRGTRLVRFDELAALGPVGVEVLSWSPGQVIPEFQPATATAVRPYQGEMVRIRTKMGRRLTVTADHPMVVRTSVGTLQIKDAGELSTTDWLPISLGAPLEGGCERSGDTEPDFGVLSPHFVLGAEQWVSPTMWRGSADSTARRLAELRVVARVDVGADGHRLTVSAGDADEYDVDDTKGTAWVRVVDLERFEAEQLVYSVEVDRNHTVVTTGGLVAHNCFPKDSRALLKIANEAGYSFDLLEGVVAVNEEQFLRVTHKIRAAAGGSLRGRTVAVWGLTFKARTDDLRDSPSISIITRLLEAGAAVQAFDPTVDGPKPGVPAAVDVCTDPYAAAAGADVLAVLTEWDDFKWLEPAKVADLMTGRAVVDGRNLLDRGEWQRAGFSYQGIGR